MTDTEKMDLILEKVTGLETNVKDVKLKVAELDERVAGLDERVVGLETDLRDVKLKVTKIDLMVENEIRVNIKRVAEGHLDLYRNLKNCLALSQEVKSRQEIQDIYINTHESRLRALEQQRA